MSYTQAEFDELVLAIASHEVRIAYATSQLRRQNEPIAFERETELIFLQNVLFGLRNYDVTSDILTDAEIEYLLELATVVVQNCPL